MPRNHSLRSLTEQLRVALHTESGEVPPPAAPVDTPEDAEAARAAGRQRTAGIPAGGKGRPSGRPKMESLSALLDRGARYLHQSRGV